MQELVLMFMNYCQFCRNKIPMPAQKCAGKILDSWRQMQYNKGYE